MDDFPDRQLGDLAADGSRDIGHGNDLPGNVMRARVRPDLVLNPLDERGRQRITLGEPDEQDDTHIRLVPIWQVLSDNDAFDDLRKLLHLP